MSPSNLSLISKAVTLTSYLLLTRWAALYFKYYYPSVLQALPSLITRYRLFPPLRSTRG